MFVRTSLSALQVANGTAIGISAYYTLIFLPIMPLALIAPIWMWMGELPMTPLISLIAAVLSRRHLRSLEEAEQAPKRHRLAWGLAAFLAALVPAELPCTVTRVGMQMAISNSADTGDRGIKLLRLLGKEDLILRACYTNTLRGPDFIGALLGITHSVGPEQARDIYYRVFGRPFNIEPIPRRLTGTPVFGPRRPRDRDIGGEQVAGKVGQLALDSSRIDGSVDRDAALAYLEWTMVLRNQSPAQQEARTLVGLPPGGVVSRATLWVNGREQEAAFAERTRVRKAYQKVVRVRRDPLLITSAGPDTVLVQCFPVPPDGGSMKIRVGITVPLVPVNPKTAALRLPYLKERNFACNKAHTVWIESKRTLAYDGNSLRTEQPSADIRALRGEIPDRELSKPAHVSPSSDLLRSGSRGPGTRYATLRL